MGYAATGALRCFAESSMTPVGAYTHLKGMQPVEFGRAVSGSCGSLVNALWEYS
jgi:hypothetical protein